MNWQEHIATNPKVMFGKPVIKGTRIPVDLILEKLAFNYSFDDLMTAYPNITIEDIQSCLLYAANNAKHDKVFAVA